MSYFLNKVNDSITRNSLVTSLSGLKLSADYTQFEKMHMDPVMNLIENECWKGKNKKNPVCKNPGQISIPSAVDG